MTAIRKRKWTNSDGNETVKWLLDYRDQNGKRRYKQFDRKKDAENWRVPAEFQVSQGTHTAESQSVTIAEAADLWIKRAENKNLERSTLHGYKNLAQLHIKPLMGSIKLSKLSRPMVIEYQDTLLEKRSQALAKKAIHALSSILGDAMDRGLVAQNVAKGVKFQRKKKTPVEIPTKAELQAIIKASDENELPLILTDILTGLRASELRGLRWQDIDFEAQTISVNQRADQWNKIGPPKSDAGFRTIPISELLVRTLRRWKLAAPISDLDLVFPSSTGTPFGYQNLLRRVFFPVQIRAGLTRVNGNQVKGKFGFHALRHAAASAWIDQNIDLKRLQVWMGHESIQITLDTYGHLIKNSAKDAAIADSAATQLMS